ncbi:two-component system sensor histidine kinase NtrB [Leptospira sp. GIMC2001]|uniref:two-component system sensor histidine kinase NtrB n=1 Tax=Leptospira sp. GIMC2001 TaxID=1513297 RepID=UPI002349FA7A|nr:sensor histidine kinase [Leptospira sp. GIMC2001]WCL49375.1 ATP-binding protein [Leptospira sp. GIMC2001]
MWQENKSCRKHDKTCYSRTVLAHYTIIFMSQFTFLDYIGQPALAIDSSFDIVGINEYAKIRFKEITNIDFLIQKNLRDLLQNSEFEFIVDQLSESIIELENSDKNFINERFTIKTDISMQFSVKKNTIDGKIVYIIAGINITEQIRKQKKLTERFQEQLEVFKTLYEMAPVGLAIKDFEGGFYKVNKGLCDITGYTKDELLELHPEDLFPSIGSSYESNLIRSLIEGESDYYKTEKKLKRSNGEIRTISETLNLIRDDLNQPYLTICSYVDITDERELQQRLLESSKMEELGKLSGGIAHDFNNMLLPVTLISDIALQEINNLPTPSDPFVLKLKNYLEKISTSAQRAKTLVQKLFQYSQSGIYQLVPIFLENEIPKAIKILNLSRPKNIELKLEISEGRFPILGEESGIQQIIDNLVVNSFHAMRFREKGTIHIRLFEEFGDAILEIEDEGHGIADEEIEKIFKPFYSGKKSDEGSGMGLIVVQTIVLKMNGRLRVYSNPGKGTVFQILFSIWNKG